MRILIDECIDERLEMRSPDTIAETVRFAGFAGLKNGELLDAAESAQFDVSLTADQGWPYEQYLGGRKIAIIIFQAKSNRRKDLLSYIPDCVNLRTLMKTGDIARIPVLN
jgi:hypothetical protein